MIHGLQVATSAGAGLDAESRPRSVEEAASAFEALFIGNLLKAAREAGAGGQLGEEDQSTGALMEMAEEYLANEVAKGGGCGLAKVITSQMLQRQDAGSQNEH